MSGYAEDLAYIHDAGYGDYSRGCTPGVLAALDAAGIDSGLVVELGCGSGIFLEALVSAGYDALGIDQSVEFIALARKRAKSARLVVSSYVDLEIPSCRAVVALGEVFNYGFDASANWASLTKVFRRVHAAMPAGGLFLFDIAEPGRGKDVASSFRVGDGWALMNRNEYDARRDRLTRHIVAFRQVGQHYRRSEETHRLQLYPAAKVAKSLRKIGFTVRIRRRIGTFELPPHIAALIVRKD